jgi:hypothetical protein
VSSSRSSNTTIHAADPLLLDITPLIVHSDGSAAWIGVPQDEKRTTSPFIPCLHLARRLLEVVAAEKLLGKDQVAGVAARGIQRNEPRLAVRGHSRTLAHPRVHGRKRVRPASL